MAALLLVVLIASPMLEGVVCAAEAPHAAVATAQTAAADPADAADHGDACVHGHCHHDAAFAPHILATATETVAKSAPLRPTALAALASQPPLGLDRPPRV